MHANQWSVEGLLSTGFKTVGKAAAFRGGVGETTHGLDAMMGTVWLTHTAQISSFSKQLNSATDEVAPGITINRYHDASPVLVRFGNLQAELYASARYLIRVDEKWKAAPYGDMRLASSGAGKSKPSSGVVEVFAQVVEVTWLRVFL